MEFKDNTNVYTFDGKDAGSLQRVVIDPHTTEVTHIVIEKGLLAREDKVVPMARVTSATQEKITLSCTMDELDQMSPLEIQQYMPAEEAASAQVYDPLTGRVTWGASPEPAILRETRRTIPEQLAAMKAGARVTSEDDEHVGSVECIFTEPVSNKVTHFSILQGLLVKTKKSIPVQWVKLLDEKEIYLNINAQQLEDIPAE